MRTESEVRKNICIFNIKDICKIYYMHGSQLYKNDILVIHIVRIPPALIQELYTTELKRIKCKKQSEKFNIIPLDYHIITNSKLLAYNF